MSDDHVYRVIEITGSSPNSISDAIQTAVSRASKTLRNLRWFEVVQTRGHIDDGKISHYQVTLKIGFTIDDSNRGADGESLSGGARRGARRPSAPASTTGTRPTTCPGRCAPSRRAGLGAAGAAAIRRCMSPFYEFDSVEAAEAATAPRRSSRWSPISTASGATGYKRRREILEMVQELVP